MSSDATGEITSAAADEISSVATEEISSVATEDWRSRDRRGRDWTRRRLEARGKLQLFGPFFGSFFGGWAS